MTDKLRRTAPLTITYSDGELPSAAKLTAENNQYKNAFGIIEKAVGDLWNQSGDSILNNYPLQLPNLARVLGEFQYLNPCLFAVDEDFRYYDRIGSVNEYQTEMFLQFKPKSLTGFTVEAGSTLTNRVDNKHEVQASGDYWVDLESGKLISFTYLTSTDQVSYIVDSSTWNQRVEVLPGVIPDPRQVTFYGCRVSTSAGKYYLHLPPRQPLQKDFDNGSFDGWSLPERYPLSADWAANYDTTVAAVGSKKLWQDPTVSALEDAFYRYSFPKEIRDVLPSLSVGDELPLGFLLLWDRSTGTILADVKFKKSSLGNWIFEITSASIDLSTYVTSNESQTSYNSTGLSVITVGASVSRLIWTLFNALMNHTHNNEGDFSALVSHQALSGLNPPNGLDPAHIGRYPTTQEVSWSGSRWANDDHLYLLSRTGSRGLASGKNRDLNDNGMIGNLLICSATPAAGPGNYINTTYVTFGIYFGSRDDGPKIYGVPNGSDMGINIIPGPGSNANALTVYGGTGSGHGLLATGGDNGGFGVYAVAGTNNGIGGYFAGATNTAPIRLEPRNGEPTVASDGDIWVDSSTGKLMFWGNGQARTVTSTP